MENLFAFLRIWTTSMVGDFGMEGVGAPMGDAGTRGTVFSPGAAAVRGCDCGGDAAGALTGDRS